MCGFVAQLVEHRTGIAEVTSSNPVEALIFSGFFQAIGKLTAMITLPFHLQPQYKYELFHTNFTILRYVELNCCDRLTWACKCWAKNVGIYRVVMLRLSCQDWVAEPLQTLLQTRLRTNQGAYHCLSRQTDAYLLFFLFLC